MSMSQEEIEALMNGLDIVDDEDSTVQEETPIVLEDVPVVNTDEIEELISQNEKVTVDEVSQEADSIETSSNEIFSDSDTNLGTVNNDDIDALLKDLEQAESKEEPSDVIEELSDLDVEPLSNNDLTAQSFDDISADEEGIVESINPSGLTPLGESLYMLSDASGDVQTANPTTDQFGSVRQGMIELSNVALVTEMVDLITAQRAYEANSKAITTTDSMLDTVNRLKS